jgi:hypothetical protein
VAKATEDTDAEVIMKVEEAEEVGEDIRIQETQEARPQLLLVQLCARISSPTRFLKT